MSKDFGPGEPALAHMVHHSYLLTWLVHTAGRAAVLLMLPPVIGWLVAGPIGVAGGALVGLVIFEIYLMSVAAPMPTDKMVALLGPEAGGGS